MVKNLEKINRFDSYKEAKQQIRVLRNDQPSTELSLFKIMFAESELEAEEKLLEKREEQIIMEWEK